MRAQWKYFFLQLNLKSDFLASTPPPYLTPSADISPHLTLHFLSYDLSLLSLSPSLPCSFTLSSCCQSLLLYVCVCMCVCKTVRPLSHDMAECSSPGAVMRHGEHSDYGDTCRRSFRLPFSTNLSLSLTLCLSLSHTQSLSIHVSLMSFRAPFFFFTLLFVAFSAFFLLPLLIFLSVHLSPPFSSLNMFFFPNTSVLRPNPLSLFSLSMSRKITFVLYSLSFILQSHHRQEVKPNLSLLLLHTAYPLLWNLIIHHVYILAKTQGRAGLLKILHLLLFKSRGLQQINCTFSF